jgi:hypothetical protein
MRGSALHSQHVLVRGSALSEYIALFQDPEQADAAPRDIPVLLLGLLVLFHCTDSVAPRGRTVPDEDGLSVR